MSSNRQIPFADGFFTWPADDPRLIGSRCLGCDAVFFPRGFRCPDPTCPTAEVKDVQFPAIGTLASCTVIRYPPPPPFVPTDPFEPFAIAEVEFDNGVQVIGPVPTESGLELELGTPMTTVVETYYTAEDGSEIVGWKFRPADSP